MKFKLLKSKAEYAKALSRLEEIFDAVPGSPEGDELEVLALLIETYEDEHFPIDAPDPVEAIKFRMDQMGLKQKDLAKLLGNKSRVSEIINGKRKLTLSMIRKLHAALNIPAEVLVQEY